MPMRYLSCFMRVNLLIYCRIILMASANRSDKGNFFVRQTAMRRHTAESCFVDKRFEISSTELKAQSR